MDDTSYGALFARQDARRLVMALGAAWSSFGMVGLAIFLTANRATNSFGIAGAAVAAFSIGSGVFAPLRGRVIDRRGPRPWLLLFSLIYGASLSTLVLDAALSLSTPLLILSAVAAGSSAPPLVASIRGLWPTVVDPSLLRRAYTLTSTIGDLALVVAPALCGVLFVVAWCSPLPIAATAALAASVIAQHGPTPTKNGSETRAASGLFASSFLVLLAVSVALGAALGLVDVAVPTVATQWGDTAFAGFLLGAFALGSVLSSLWFGRREWQRPADQRYLLAVLLLAVALIPPIIATNMLLLAPLLVIAGLGYGPATISLFEALDLTAPTHATEALTWVTTAEALGIAAGAATSGWMAARLGLWTPFAVGSMLLSATVGLALAARLKGDS